MPYQEKTKQARKVEFTKDKKLIYVIIGTKSTQNSFGTVSFKKPDVKPKWWQF